MSTTLQSLYTLPLWLQILVQQEDYPDVKGLLRQTTKILNDPILLTKKDKKYVINKIRIGRYHTTKNYELIADDSEEGNETYNYYHQMLISGLFFLQNNF